MNLVYAHFLSLTCHYTAFLRPTIRLADFVPRWLPYPGCTGTARREVGVRNTHPRVCVLQVIVDYRWVLWYLFASCDHHFSSSYYVYLPTLEGDLGNRKVRGAQRSCSRTLTQFNRKPIVRSQPPWSHIWFCLVHSALMSLTAMEYNELGSKYQFPADHVRLSSLTLAAHHGWTQSCWRYH